MQKPQTAEVNTAYRLRLHRVTGFWRVSGNLLTALLCLRSYCSEENKKNPFKRIDALQNGNRKPVNSLIPFLVGSPSTPQFVICIYTLLHGIEIYFPHGREEYPAIVWFEVRWPAEGERDHCSVYGERSQVLFYEQHTTAQWRTGFEFPLIQLNN